MKCLFSILSGLACLALAYPAKSPLVPGLAFDRFITIWLENQVSG